MKHTVNSQEKRISELEDELQSYRELLSRIPAAMSYRDYNRGIHIQKDRGLSLPKHSKIEKRLLPSELKQDLLLEQDVPFEKIEEFLLPIFDTIPHHIVFINAHGCITLCNKKTAEDLDVDRDSIIGKHIRDLLNLPDDLIMLLETLRTGNPIVNREVLDTNYGINNTWIYRDVNGNIIRVLGAFQSLNLVKESEKQALAGRIAAGIAHEIRNPLTTVRGYLQFIKGGLSPDISELIHSLLIPELDRANKIISDFLTIAKPSETKAEMVNFNEFIKNQLGPLLKSEAFLHNVEVIFDCSPDVDDELVSINSSEMLQIFINLFRNAVDAKSERPMKIKLKTKVDQQRLQIVFSDNGNGIPANQLEHIFDPFFTTKDEGTGLGLSLSRKMVENHGGSISVRSSEKGTSFYIQLPYERKK
ncbi:signal transduction histidine kinase [Bacillus mesophilus]|uniref:two-component system sensor histidine kinase NtrB n=1 Tax=Bacillus mesophilus TaxID=1808955 RepID=UPI001969A89C|nr:ATP-binding protein [Bacillus mesophilus]MBM7663078.1 signal transduction histidine kinase [Bacillus mesophilus]